MPVSIRARTQVRTLRLRSVLWAGPRRRPVALGISGLGRVDARDSSSHRPRGGGRRARGRRLAAGPPDRRLLRDRLRRQPHAQGPHRGPPDVRRPLLLRRRRVRRPRARAASARPTWTATRSSATRTTSWCSSTPATTAARPIEFRVNPRGIQGDAIYYDADGNEDFAPDFFYDTRGAHHRRAAGRPEMRIPFSSLRYPRADPQTWGILLWRNYPRDFRYLIYFSSPPAARLQLPHLPLQRAHGPHGLPSGAHLVAAPYVSRPGRGRRGAPAGRAARGRRRRRRRGPRREVDARPPTPPSTPRQPRLLADRGRRGADRGQQPLRALLSREAAVLPGGRRPLRHADPGGLHPHHHLAALGRLRGDRQARAHWPTPCSRRRTAAAAASSCPGPPAPRRAARTSGRSWASAACASDLALVLPEPALRRPRDRGRRPQPGLRSRLPVAARRGRRGDRPAPVERHRDPGRVPTWPPSGTAARCPATPGLLGRTPRARGTRFAQLQDVGDGFRDDQGFVPQVGYRRGYGGGRAHLLPRRGPPDGACGPSSSAEYAADREGDLLTSSYGGGFSLAGRREPPGPPRHPTVAASARGACSWTAPSCPSPSQFEPLAAGSPASRCRASWRGHRPRERARGPRRAT